VQSFQSELLKLAPGKEKQPEPSLYG